MGLCYGMQLMSHVLGGQVKASTEREFGKTVLNISDNKIFDGIKQDSTVWMSHVDKVVELPEGFKTIAKTDNTENAAIASDEKKLYGFQFHPEVNHSEFGTEMLKTSL